MKHITRVIMVVALLVSPIISSAQVSVPVSSLSDPEGHLTYSLPMTVILLEVEAVQEKFFAGPYAKFAEKYLGFKARQVDETSFTIKSISMCPYVEADQSKRFSLPVMEGKLDATFLNLSSSGLVSFGNTNLGKRSHWRFTTDEEGDFSTKGVSSNLMSESSTLYRNAKKESAYNRMSVQQNMIVEKTVERRAAETAEMILELRKKRLQIVTGDTDATYSGEAMGAAVEEITRLEQEYMTLFVGYTEVQDQTMNFEVIPSAERESQMYVAFRLSDVAGLVPADNLSGKPVVMEIVPQEFEQIVIPVVEEDPKEKKKAKRVRRNDPPQPIVVPMKAYYRMPAICTVKITDGVHQLLQTRIPVYQLGQESAFPVNVIYEPISKK